MKMREIGLFILLMPLFMGTTYIVKEGGKEVGRFEENDGQKGEKVIKNDPNKINFFKQKAKPQIKETETRRVEKFLNKVHGLNELDPKLKELQDVASKFEVANDARCLSYENTTLVDRCQSDLRLAQGDLKEFLDSFNEPERLRAGFADLAQPVSMAEAYRKVLSALQTLINAKADFRGGNAHEGNKKLKEYGVLRDQTDSLIAQAKSAQAPRGR